MLYIASNSLKLLLRASASIQINDLQAGFGAEYALVDRVGDHGGIQHWRAVARRDHDGLSAGARGGANLEPNELATLCPPTHWLPRGEQCGIVAASRKGRTFPSGLFCYRVEDDLTLGRVIVADHFVAVDLLDPGAVLAALVE